MVDILKFWSWIILVLSNGEQDWHIDMRQQQRPLLADEERTLVRQRLIF